MPRYVIACDPDGSRGGPVLRGGALALWKCRDEAVLSGPAETGKTWGACYKLDALLWKYPRAQAVVCRKVRATVYGTVLQTYHKVIGFDPARERSPGGVTRYGGEAPDFYDYPNGSRLWVAGLDNLDKALSSERDFIYVNQAEELDGADWEVLTTRATGRAGNAPYGQVFGDCNPSYPHHWIRRRAAAGDLRLIESRHEDNSALWDAGRGGWTEQGRRTIGALDRLTGERKERLRWGRWVAAEGAIFSRAHVRYFLTSRAGEPSVVLHDPDGDRRYPVADCRMFQTVDTALTVRTYSNHTAVATLMLTPDADLLVHDLFRARIEVPYQYATIRELRLGPRKWFPERNQALGSLRWPRDILQQYVEDKASGVGLIQQSIADGRPFGVLKADADKVTRAQPLAALYEAGKVYHRHGAAWVPGFEDRLLAFPAGDELDEVDALAHAARLLGIDRILRAYLDRPAAYDPVALNPGPVPGTITYHARGETAHLRTAGGEVVSVEFED
jgi:predicted phage terminase large subunit-like protein